MENDNFTKILVAIVLAYILVSFAALSTGSYSTAIILVFIGAGFSYLAIHSKKNPS